MDDKLLRLIKANGVAEDVKGEEINKAIRKEYSQDEVEAIILNTLDSLINTLTDDTANEHKQELQDLLEYRKKCKASVKDELEL